MKHGRQALLGIVLGVMIVVGVAAASTPLTVADSGHVVTRTATQDHVLKSFEQSENLPIDGMVAPGTAEPEKAPPATAAPSPQSAAGPTRKAAVSSAPIPRAPAEKAPTPRPKASTGAPPSSATATGSLKGHHIIVDPGHGGDNSGAVGVNGRPEDATVLDIALRFARLLKDAGATVTMTRDGDYSPTVKGHPEMGQLEARTLIANRSGGEIFVSIHDNWYDDPAATGIMAFVFTQASATSRSLASNLYREVVASSGLPAVDMQTANFYVLRETTMPAVLMELGFLSNAGDADKLSRPEFRQRLAQGLFNGIQAFYDK